MLNNISTYKKKLKDEINVKERSITILKKQITKRKNEITIRDKIIAELEKEHAELKKEQEQEHNDKIIAEQLQNDIYNEIR